MITNKEVIHKLKTYYLTQDREVVAHVLAVMMIDLQRVWNYGKLEKDEAISLKQRMRLNMQELDKFIKEGPQGDLIIGPLDDH